MDDFALQLAREARRLHLLAGATNDDDALLEFAELVLAELAARGLIAEESPEIGCWAMPRPRSN